MRRTLEAPKWDPGKVSTSDRLGCYFRLIRLEHTLFSLPFAYAGALLSGYPVDAIDILLISLAVFGLRSAGMAYNDIVDKDIDILNPRTCNRPLVKGVVSLHDAWMTVFIGSTIYFISAFFLNIYAFILSPFLWLIIMTYPYAKRWHCFPHFHLGLALGMVVFGGAVGVSGKAVSTLFEALEAVPYIYIIAIMFWVAGFDIIYSIMDVGFDLKYGLGSIPARFGVDSARYIALSLHVLSLASLICGYFIYNLGLIGLSTILLTTILIGYQHLITMRNLLNIPKAFNINLAISIIISVGIVVAKASIL